MSKAYFFLNDIPAASTQNKREAWMPKNGLGYFDKAANRWFDSRAEKRAWLTTHGMRETGELHNPNKHIAGRARTRRSPEQQRQHQAVQAFVQSLGGTQGLLDRLARKRQQGGVW